MKWASVLSTNDNLSAAIAEAADSLLEAMSCRPTVVFLFVSSHYQLHFDSVPELFKKELPDTVLVGCSARGIFAGGYELEDEVGIGMIGAHLPDVSVLPFHLDGSSVDPTELVSSTESKPQVVLFSDPVTFDTEAFLQRINESEKQPSIIGGVASAGHEAAYNALFLNDRMYKRGAVGVLLEGNITFEQFVTPGSRPIGDPYFVTRVKDNLLYELDGMPCVSVIDDLMADIPDSERIVFEEECLLGVIEPGLNEDTNEAGPRICQILGSEPASGLVVLDSPITVNSIVQFHIGDPFHSHELLLKRMKRFKKSKESANLSGALVFSCTRRGEGFYQEPDHETSVFKECFNSVPLGGFFSYGELIQDNGKAKICGLSSAYGFFRPRNP